jgi:hypothetical protein
MFFYSNEMQVRKFEVENLTNVARPHLKSEALSNLKNLFCTLCQT